MDELSEVDLEDNLEEDTSDYFEGESKEIKASVFKKDLIKWLESKEFNSVGRPLKCVHVLISLVKKMDFSSFFCTGITNIEALSEWLDKQKKHFEDRNLTSSFVVDFLHTFHDYILDL